ncbi:Protein PTST homolog 2, chloroplastic [Linum perenne]
MKNSDESGMFPSKKQLIDAGRMDLVEGIVREYGWLASVWDLEGDCQAKPRGLRISEERVVVEVSPEMPVQMSEVESNFAAATGGGEIVEEMNERRGGGE